jgi:hypothetical protein
MGEEGDIAGGMYNFHVFYFFSRLMKLQGRRVGILESVADFGN